jgi:uncharacterized protein
MTSTKTSILPLLILFVSVAVQAAPASHEVRILTPDPEVTLAGTLLAPKSSIGGTVVLLITGSGDHPRDAVISGTPLFQLIAEDLAAVGIASLRLDDRGTAESTGPSTRQSTTADRVIDMNAALDWLRQNDIAEFAQFGLMGHSEGADIALRMAAGQTPPDFAVLIGAPVLKGSDVWVEQQYAGFRQSVGIEDADVLEQVRAGLEEAARLSVVGADAEAMRANTTALFALANIDLDTEEGQTILQGFNGRMVDPWMRHFLADNPGEVLDKVRTPVLAIYGSHDRQTSPAQNAGPLIAGLTRAGNQDVTLHVLPEQDHFFLRIPGEPVGVHRFGEMELSGELLEIQREWILKRYPVSAAQ